MLSASQKPLGLLAAILKTFFYQHVPPFSVLLQLICMHIPVIVYTSLDQFFEPRALYSRGVLNGAASRSYAHCQPPPLPLIPVLFRLDLDSSTLETPLYTRLSGRICYHLPGGSQEYVGKACIRFTNDVFGCGLLHDELYEMFMSVDARCYCSSVGTFTFAPIGVR